MARLTSSVLLMYAGTALLQVPHDYGALIGNAGSICILYGLWIFWSLPRS